MTVLVVTTQIDVLALPPEKAAAERYDVSEEDWTVVEAHAIDANIGVLHVTSKQAGAEQIATYPLQCDYLGLTRQHRVKDLATGDVYTVLFARRDVRLGLDRMLAELQIVGGETAT